MKCRAYLTDEGFGPLVRFAAVLEQLRRRIPGLEVEVQTYNHVEVFESLTEHVVLRKRHNLIRWDRHTDGRPDIAAIREYYSDYETRSRQYIREHLTEDTHLSFVISDFVYEAFEIAYLQRVPCFGIAHFTWDWFFGKLYPHPIPATVLARWQKQASLATRIFFPDFTPEEIIVYHENAVQVPLIVRPMSDRPLADLSQGYFNILIVDSGSKVLHESLSKALVAPRPRSKYRFFVRHGMVGQPADDVVVVPPEHKLVDLMPQMDLVIGRAGFNTISECLAARVPMLLLGEAMNPEMVENIMAMKARNLASFVEIKSLATDLLGTIEQFLAGEYWTTKKQLATHSINFNGAQVIADAIVDIVV